MRVPRPCQKRKDGAPTVPEQEEKIDGTFSRALQSCSFPQPSTERNPNPVTNDLYREFRKAQPYYVRKFSIAGSCSNPEAKSLFQKILAVSPYASRFCRPHEIPAPASHLQSVFCPLTAKKMLRLSIARRAVGSGAQPTSSCRSGAYRSSERGSWNPKLRVACRAWQPRPRDRKLCLCIPRVPPR